MQVLERPYHSQVLSSIFDNYEPPVAATIRLLGLLGANVPDQEINDYILSHPDYPSLLSISDCLREQGFENIALKTEKDKIEEYPLPMIAHTGEDFKIVHAIDDTHVSYIDENGKNRKVSRNGFLNKWNGIALLVQTPEIPEEQKAPVMASGNRKLISKFLLPVAAVLAIIITAAVVTPFLQPAQQVSYASLLLLKFCGIFICGLLLWYQADNNNPVMKKICGSEKASKTSCQAILNSAQSNIFRGLSWSEAGFFYFAGSLITLLLFPSLAGLVAWMNVLALPYVIFSVVYQKFVAKNWCPLCLAVQGILVLEFVAAVTTGLIPAWSSISLTASMIFQLLVLFSLPVIAWYFSKPFISGFIRNKSQGYQLARIKHDEQVFNVLLGQQKKIAGPADHLGIVLGNPDAKNTIVKVCNPYCAPCARTHQELEDLLSRNKDVKVQIIFTATNHPGDTKTPPVKHLLAIAAEGDTGQTKKALDDWYGSDKKDYEVFAGKYRMNGELKKQDQKVDEMAEWCRATGISFTPTLFINGYQLPQLYSVSDLKYMLTG